MEVSDIRMKGFQERVSVDEFFSLIDQFSAVNAHEMVSVTDCGQRVLAKDIHSPTTVPNFERSAMDGFAVKGEETFGAAEYNPISFKIVGQVTPGMEFSEELKTGETVRIMTGAPIPKGADAVLMAEYTEQIGDQMQAFEAVSPGKHVGRIGEDIQKGELLFKSQRKIRPQDAAVLASVGVSEVPVIKCPTVDLLITGNELLKPGEQPDGVKIIDSNSVILRNSITRDGGIIQNIYHLKDDRELIKKHINESTADIICVTGGTAVGVDDFAPSLVQELGKLLVHGVSIRPASPTGFGVINQKKIFLLPGNPVSCLSAYEFFVSRTLKILGGLSLEWPYKKESMPLATKISSQVGRVEYVRVTIEDGKASLLAASGASVLSSTTRADGFLITPEQSEGFAEGEVVDIWLYD